MENKEKRKKNYYYYHIWEVFMGNFSEKANTKKKIHKRAVLSSNGRNPVTKKILFKIWDPFRDFLFFFSEFLTIHNTTY